MRRAAATACVILALVALLSGCGESATPPLKTATATTAGTSPSANGVPATTGVEADTPATIAASPAATALESEVPTTIGASPTATDVPEAEVPQGTLSTYLLFNQKLLEGLSVDTLDLNDVDEVFGHIFSNLPGEVVVYPSENYYYFILYVDRRQIWGNIRLATGSRDRGVLSFAYFEFKETPYVTDPRVTKSKFFTDADGLLITELDEFTYRVRYNKREVVFRLHELSQEPPNLFQLGDGEEFVMRTFDESGYQFFLLFNGIKNYFIWVLNEEEPLPDNLMPLEDDLLVGRKSGFAFWVDEAHDNRKVLMAISGESNARNDYYDGPFDQLADNYVEVTNVSDYMIRWAPSLRDRIDKYGYFTNRDRPSRVSISPYYFYFTEDALMLFLQRTREAEEPTYFISRKGLIPTPTPAPAPTPGSR